MRRVHVQEIRQAVEQGLLEINTRLSGDIRSAVGAALGRETSPRARRFLQLILDNDEIARREHIPLCQDTGMVLVDLSLGQDVVLTGGDITSAIDQGIRDAYSQGYFRASMVSDPLDRVNTGDNTPGILHFTLVPGNKIEVGIMVKGAGSENMSQVRMLQPAAGVSGIRAFILEVVKTAGAGACPPVVVGVGVGGSMDKACWLAKRALFRNLGQPHERDSIARLERDMLEEINRLGLGPQGMGGMTTALGVSIEVFPAHIASLPVAVNLSCHLNRRKRIEI